MKYKPEKHLFDKDTHSLHRYNELCKEARTWNNMGQYWLAKATQIQADQLFNGKILCKDIIIKTEDFFWKTKKHVH